MDQKTASSFSSLNLIYPSLFLSCDGTRSGKRFYFLFLLVLSISNNEDEDAKEEKLERKSLPELLNITIEDENFVTRKNLTSNKILMIGKKTRTRLVLDP